MASPTSTSTLLDDAPPAHVVLAPGVSVNAAAHTEAAKRLLAPDALALVARLHRQLERRRQELLAARAERQARYDAGETPAFLPADEHPEAHGDWQVADLPADCRRRRVEITGPVSDPKMVINMLSRTDDGHRADAAMLDFEDAMKPSWTNVMAGLDNLVGAAEGTLEHVKYADDGSVAKTYRLDPDDMPLLMVRVRGLHLDESNLHVDGTPVSGGLMDLALSLYHVGKALMDQGKTPKFYVPKCEHYLEARWWNDLFAAAQEALSIPRGTLRATFLIETLPAAFQMEEILYEFREHAAGLNGGRWDKIFSDIKVLRAHADRVLADRGSIGVSSRPWMKNYVLQLIRVCHRRGALGMGGMAAFTPGRTPERRREQTDKVVADKTFEASIGHDGCWVSHPYFISHAMKPFEARLQGRDNQLDVVPDLPEHPDLLPESTPPRTLDGLRKNVRVGIAYVKGWTQHIGCVAWDDLMEDLATLEISRAQTWQWLHHRVALDDGTAVTPELVRQVFAEEAATIEDEVRAAMAGRPAESVDAEVRRYREAAEDAEAVFLEETFRPFLTGASDPADLTPAERRARLRSGGA